MAQSESGEGEVLRALDLADGYLMDAEEVLWTAASESETDVSDTVTDLTEDVWELQHQLRDLRDQVES